MRGPQGTASVWVGALALLASSAVSAQFIPLDDPAGGPPYMGMYELGLYPDRAVEMPADHYAEGIARANTIVPLDTNGNYDPVNGEIILMSQGMSNTAGPWCNTYGRIPAYTENGVVPCRGSTLGGRVRNPGGAVAVNDRLHVVPGAFVSQTAAQWIDDNGGPLVSNPPNPDLPDFYGNYTRLRDYFFPYETPPVTEAQVQVMWMKHLNPGPQHSLPGSNADAYQLLDYLGRIIRFSKQRYPNLKMVFITSSAYRGFSDMPLFPEPFGYETGFTVKWLIEAQIRQMRNGGVVTNPLAGDLNYADGTAPWIAWGPYMWSDGTTSRSSDLLNWSPGEYVSDGVHLFPQGLAKFGIILHHFFTNSPFTRCWFVGDAPCE